MAVYCDREAVLQQIDYLRELFYASSKNDTLVQVGGDFYSTSPPNDWMGYSRSLDQAVIPIRAAQEKKREEKEKKKAAAGQSQGKEKAKKTVDAIKWKPHVPKPGEKSPFRKYDIEELPQESLLSSVITPAKALHLRVFIVLDAKPSGPLKIKVFDSETVQGVIQAAITKCQEENQMSLPTEDGSAYILRMAESDGSVDTDVPALNSNSQISTKWGADFALVRNPKFDFGDKSSASKKLMLIVHLPGNQKTTVPLVSTNETKISDLIRKVCDRRLWSVADYYVRRLEDPAPLPSEMSLNDLGTTEVQLCSNLDMIQANEGDEDGDVEFWSEVRAFTYKQYSVHWIKKRSHMEERELGIDGERIKIEKKKGNSIKRQDVKKFSDLKSISGNDKNPKLFVLEWTDGKTDQFEAPSPKIAKEIIGKVSYIKERKGQSM